MDAEFLVLGAGQEVGRSCVVLCCNGVNIMFDCGLHMGKKGDDRLPLLDVLGDDINAQVHLLVVTHFHLDHVGAVPYLTEVLGYKGPVVMTTATKAIVPIILEDYHNICNGRGDSLYTKQQIDACLERVVGINIEEPFQLPGLTVTAYYAGHVIGAAMMYCTIGSASVLYTGDYNMVSDRLLGAAKVPRLRPDVLITESTYATTLRDPKRAREGKLLDSIHSIVKNGGKVLVPVFAVGSAQEMSLLIDSFWQRMHLNVPVYMTEGMATRAAALLTTLSEWGSQGFRNSHVEQLHSTSLPKRFELWRPEYATNPGPCVLFATPGMLQGGVSLQVLKLWAPCSKNMVLIPGTCTAGTVGGLLIHTKKSKDGKRVKLDGNTELRVRCKVEHQMTFSAHTDAKGVVDLVHQVQPRAAILVHGEVEKMKFLIQHLQMSFNIPCYCPATGESVHIQHAPVLPLTVSSACMDKALHECGAGLVRECIKDLCAAGASTSQVSAAQTLWGAVSKTELGQAIEGSTDAETALQMLLPSEAPSCWGKTMQVSGQLHGYQTSNQRQLLLTATSDECAGSPSGDGSIEAEHRFTAPAHVSWDAATNIGTVQVPDGTTDVQGGTMAVQVARSAVPMRQKGKQPPLDEKWMWDLLWAETLDKTSMNV